MELKVGDKVHYTPTRENGIVKAAPSVKAPSTMQDNEPRVDIVYHCNNNWQEYQLYGGIATKVKNLKKDWLPGRTRTD